METEVNLNSACNFTERGMNEVWRHYPCLNITPLPLASLHKEVCNEAGYSILDT